MNPTAALNHDDFALVANTIRMLSVDAVEKANSGHPGMPMGMADIAAVVSLKHLQVNPRDPRWINRDRLVISNGHGSMLLYSLLHLMGYDLSLEDLRQFRQWDSKTPGHPESFITPGVECTTGPLGQGISNAVGMAIGAKIMAARYNSDRQLFHNKVVVFAGDGCLMEGVSSEASSLAGHLGLENLIVIYDDNHISIAGNTQLAFSEDVKKRYEAYGWYVQDIDGHDYAAIDGALESAIAESSRPSFIAARTLIGKGSPNKNNTHDVHGSPLGKDEVSLTRKNLGWTEETFFVPSRVRELFAQRAEEFQAAYEDWQQKFGTWRKNNAALAEQLDRQLSLSVPNNLDDALLAALPTDGKPAATRKLSGIVLQELSKQMNSLLGGSADLEPSTLTLIAKAGDIQRESFGGKNLRFGVREHGMGAIMNGLSYYGGFLPYGSTFLCFADYMRPTLRLAALSHIPGLFIFTHDSVFLGEDGPTHQPVEHLASLRIIPNLWTFRPADGVETAVSYAIAAKRKDGPCAMIFTRQNLPALERSSSFRPSDIDKGAYLLWEAGSGKSLTIVATGSEVPLALDAAKRLSAKRQVRVVSMPCVELFKQQSADFRRNLVPQGDTVVVEAAVSFGWTDILKTSPETTLTISLDHFGASAPAEVLAEKFGFTPESVCQRIESHFGS